MNEKANLILCNSSQASNWLEGSRTSRELPPLSLFSSDTLSTVKHQILRVCLCSVDPVHMHRYACVDRWIIRWRQPFKFQEENFSACLLPLIYKNIYRIWQVYVSLSHVIHYFSWWCWCWWRWWCLWGCSLGNGGESLAGWRECPHISYIELHRNIC